MDEIGLFFILMAYCWVSGVIVGVLAYRSYIFKRNPELYLFQRKEGE